MQEPLEGVIKLHKTTEKEIEGFFEKRMMNESGSSIKPQKTTQTAPHKTHKKPSKNPTKIKKY